MSDERNIFRRLNDAITEWLGHYGSLVYVGVWVALGIWVLVELL